MATASLAGIPPDQARSALHELAGCHLVTEHPPGRFAFHDMLRTYAAEQAADEDSETARRDATRNALDYYLHSAHRAAVLLNPARDVITLQPAQPGVTPEELSDHTSAMTWLTAEHQVLLAVIRWAALRGFDNHASMLPWTLTDFYDNQGFWHDLSATQNTALRSAQRNGNRTAQAYSYRALGRVSARLQLFDQAGVHYRHAAELARQLEDRTGQAHGELDLGWICSLQGRHDGALDHAEKALDMYRAGGNRSGQAVALNAVGWSHIHLGNFSEALTRCREALDVHRELNDRDGEAAALDSVGLANYHLRQFAEALAYYGHSLELFDALGDRYHVGDVLVHTGDALDASGDHTAARHAWRRALAILRDLHDSDAESVRVKLRKRDTPATA
jgi:tetratricopeptide (TPR) repeat protein